MTSREAIQRAAAHISIRDAETLLQHVAGRNRASLLAHPEADLPPNQQETFFALVRRRELHEPLQYLTGQQEFFGLSLSVTPDVLIPRPETELLVEAALHWLQPHEGHDFAETSQPKIVDVGTGSGAIALALASQLPKAEIWAVDVSELALAVAQRNAERLGFEAAVRFCSSDLLNVFCSRTQESARPFDVVISNPPYVPGSDAPTMQPEVRDFEPHLALFAGEDGMAIYRRLVPQAWQVLRTGGLLAMEFGFGQRDALADLLQEWHKVRFIDDYAGIPRIVLAEKPRS